MSKLFIPELNVAPYSPTEGDRCARCVESHEVVARRLLRGWAINLCDSCLLPEERAEMSRLIAEALYLSGVN